MSLSSSLPGPSERTLAGPTPSGKAGGFGSSSNPREKHCAASISPGTRSLVVALGYSGYLRIVFRLHSAPSAAPQHEHIPPREKCITSKCSTECSKFIGIYVPDFRMRVRMRSGLRERDSPFVILGPGCTAVVQFTKAVSWHASKWDALAPQALGRPSLRMTAPQKKEAPIPAFLACSPMAQLASTALWSLSGTRSNSITACRYLSCR